MPAARAPATSESGWSPTKSASAGVNAGALERRLEDARVRLGDVHLVRGDDDIQQRCQPQIDQRFLQAANDVADDAGR